MNLFKKIYDLILVIIVCAAISWIENVNFIFGKFINNFYHCTDCTDCLGCSFPCYGIYDIWLMAIVIIIGVVSFGIIIFKLIKFFHEK
jgi:hypothetical protein